MRKTIVATLIIFATALLVSALLAAARHTNHPDKNIHALSASRTTDSINNSADAQIADASSWQIQQEDTAAVSTATEEFRPRKILTASTPNFSTPLRRAPLRRKGNVQG